MARKGRSTRRDQERKRDRDQDDREQEDRDLMDATAENRRGQREDGDEAVEIVRVDPDNPSERYRPSGEAPLDLGVIDADINADEVMDDIDDFTDDEEVLQDFSERQHLINEGSDELREEINVHHFRSPEQSGDDIDAAWQDSVVSGEESVGGSAPTPDQDVVDELGKALGFTYGDNEPLHTAEKLEERDQDRWELNPASVEEIEEQEDEMEDQDNPETNLYLEGDYDLEMLAEEDTEEENLEEVDLEDVEEEEEISELLTEDDSEEDLDDEDEYDDLDLEDDDLDDYLDDLYDDDED